MTNPSANEMGLASLLHAALNRGVFDRHARNRPQQHVWESNFAGIPAVKKRDAVHEATFGFHDLIHMLAGEAVLLDERDVLSQQLSHFSRMSGEGVTLYTADGLFAESLRRSGIEYDYTARKAHPFLVGDLGYLERTPGMDELRGLIHANARFFVLGDTSGFDDLLAGRTDRANMQRYIEWYSVFSVKDHEWTERNYHQLRRQGGVRRVWWDATAPLRGLYPELNLQSVSELKNRLDVREAARDTAGLRTLLGLVVDEMFDRVVKPYYGNAAVELVSPALERSRAFTRWLIGQLYLFDVYAELPLALRTRDRLVEAVMHEASRNGGVIRYAAMEDIRALYEDFLGRLEAAGRISREEQLLWADTFPHFPVNFISYDTSENTSAAVVQRILLDCPGRPSPDDVAPGTVVLMTDAARYILQQKDELHPNERCRGTYSMFGGSCDTHGHLNSHELTWVGLLRELLEELFDVETAREIYHRSRLWRNYTLSGNQFPGSYPLAVYVAHVEPETLSRWHAALSKPGVVQEGKLALVESREALHALLADTDNFIASLDVPIREYVSTN